MRKFASILAMLFVAGWGLTLVNCGGNPTQSKLNERIVSTDGYPVDSVIVVPIDGGVIGPIDPYGSTWLGNYFHSTNLSGPVYHQEYYPGNSLSLNWGTGSFAAGHPQDKFSARFEKTVYLSGWTEFKGASDDGIRAFLYPISGARPIEIFTDWTEHSIKNYSVAKNIPAGQYRIVLEYYENTGLAALSFSYGNNTPEPVYGCSGDQWTVKRFNNINMTGYATTECQNYPSNNVSVNWGQGLGDNWSAIWTKQFTPEQYGDYKFYAKADDALEVLLDGESIVWSDLYRGVPNAEVTKRLNGGQTYTITLKYKEYTGDASFNFSVELMNCGTVSANILTCVRPWSETFQNRRVEICPSNANGQCIGKSFTRTSFGSNAGVTKIDGLSWNSCTPAPYYKVVRFQDNDPNAVWVGQLHPGDVRTSFWCD